MPTIHDVAKHAGVGSITVSRVINNSGYLSKETRARVEQAIAELGYVPNTLARSLRSKRTNTLALVLTDITNPFFTTLARGVEDAASKAGYTLIFCNSDESAMKESTYVNILLQKQVDGFLLVPAQSKTTTIELIHSRAVPVVVIDRAVPGIAVDVVRCDSEEGAFGLTRLLLELGHRHIACLCGPKGVSTADDRAAGFLRALRSAGIAPGRDCILRGELSQEGGYLMAQQALRMAHKPSALLAANNFITIGAMKAAQEAGERVPEDIALVGFDDLPAAMVTFPFFTVAIQPAYEMGRKATEILLQRLKSHGAERQHEEVIFPTQIIVRRSSGDSVMGLHPIG